jgi:hypothetical protein
MAVRRRHRRAHSHSVSRRRRPRDTKNDNVDIPKAALAWPETGSGIAPQRDQRELETGSSAFLQVETAVSVPPILADA